MRHPQQKFYKSSVIFICSALLLLSACSEAPKTSQGSRQITIPPFRPDASSEFPDAEAENPDATMDQDAGFFPDAEFAPDTGEAEIPDAGQEPSDAGEEPPPAIPACLKRCSDVRDCVLAPGGLYDLDNYECTSEGFCEWTGCNSDSECAAALNNTRYVCDQTAVLPSCVLTCNSANDCVSNSTAMGAFDADNYSCNQQRCSYAGCNSDMECVTSLGAGYRCVSGPQTQVNYCSKACAAASDCATISILYDEDNYECRSGTCAYTGCNTDMECATGFNNQDYICVTP